MAELDVTMRNYLLLSWTKEWQTWLHACLYLLVWICIGDFKASIVLSALVLVYNWYFISIFSILLAFIYFQLLVSIRTLETFYILLVIIFSSFIRWLFKVLSFIKFIFANNRQWLLYDISLWILIQS